MVADALETDRLITMVLLKPGHEGDYEGAPPIYETGCLGHILHHELLADGRSNLILRGLCRVRLDCEESSDRLYRTARVIVLNDRCEVDSGAVARLRESLHETLVELLSLAGRSGDLQKLEAIEQISLGRYCDLVCHWLGLDLSVKQTLLAEVQVEARAETLLAWMRAMVQTRRRREDTGGGQSGFSPN
jgi:Lon protease-like protein